MHEPRDLERDSLTNWQPVRLPQHWCDVVGTTGACDQASGSVLHRLKALKKSVTDTIKQWVTVVKATRDERLDKRLGGIHGQRTDDWSELAYPERQTAVTWAASDNSRSMTTFWISAPWRGQTLWRFCEGQPLCRSALRCCLVVNQTLTGDCNGGRNGICCERANFGVFSRKIRQ